MITPKNAENIMNKKKSVYVKYTFAIIYACNDESARDRQEKLLVDSNKAYWNFYRENN